MKNLIIVLFTLAAFSAAAQKEQTTPDFSVECPCVLEAKQQGNLTIYACDMFATNSVYRVEVERYPDGLPGEVTEMEFLQGYYRDLTEKGPTPELVSFRDMYAVQFRVTEHLSVKTSIISDNLVFFHGGKRYAIIVTTVSGTRRTLFKDFTNSFEVK